MAKICLIGAGSTVFARRLVGDVLLTPGLKDSEIALHDIDLSRLKTSEIVTQRMARTLGLNNRVTATTDRRKALRDADYVILMMQVGGYQPSTVIDFEIPKKYGLRQTIADTLGVGGDHACASDHSGDQRNSGGHGRSLSCCHHAELCQPHGDALHGNQSPNP